MRRWLLSVIVALGLALGYAPGRADAHPLGNFTVNQYSRLVVGHETIGVRYIVDMAEIPAFQERQTIDSDADGQVSLNEQQVYLQRQIPTLVSGLQLVHGATPIELRVTGQELSFPTGQGGLTTLRLVLDLEGTHQETEQPAEIVYTVSNYSERLGWREIVVQASDGVTLNHSSAPSVDQSNELSTYPEDMLSSPPDVREARFRTAPGAVSSTSARPAEVTGTTLGRAADGFAELIAPGELTPAVMLGGLLLAFILGAGHALTPGHGKTVVAAYLVGARGTAMHALFLGITTTITHTAGVFLLGFVTLAVSNYILPEQIYPWLEFLSGALVVTIGLALFRSRLAGVLRRTPAADHSHDHTPGIDHEHGPNTHTHDHDYEIADWAATRARNKAARGTVSWRSLLALGISGGLLPCPSALVVLLSAIALHRVGYGLLLIVAFSAGLATVLTAIGMLLVYARGLFDHFPSSGRVMRVLPIASALLVTLAGCAITMGALVQTGIL